MKLISGAAAVFLAMTPLRSVEPSKEHTPVIAHEWGTFTSIAGTDGRALQWAPLVGPADLPCFVASLGPWGFKDRASGLVRMETPVIYFYSQVPVTLSVRVGFPQGWVTEWYPQATRVTPSLVEMSPAGSFSGGEIHWDGLEVRPGENPKLPSSTGQSHYYVARKTDAAPLRMGTQWEKLIFYRGVGDFAVPLRPLFTAEGRLRITIQVRKPFRLQWSLKIAAAE